MHNASMLIARLGLSLIFILAGISKLAAWHASASALAVHGIAPGLLPLVIIIELGGGLLVLCGLITRWAAALLCIYAIVGTIGLHANFADHTQWTNFMQHLAIAGGFLVLAVHGPGGLSLDAWRKRRRQRKKMFF